jgi:serine/threonine protein kinase
MTGSNSGSRSPDRSRLWSLRLTTDGAGRRLITALAIVAVGGILTSVIFVGVRRQDDARVRAGFEQDARELAAGVRRGFSFPLEVFLTLPAFYEASEFVSPDEFRLFVTGALERHPHIYAFQWLPIVPGAERAAWEARAVESGLTDFFFRDLDPQGGITPAPDRSEYVPIFYEQPPHPPALGLDLAANALQVAALTRARRENRPAASEPFTLLEAPDSGLCVSVYAPIHGSPPGSPPQSGSPRPVVGFVRVILRVQAVMDTVLADVAHEDIDIALTTGAGATAINLLFENTDGAAADIRSTSGMSWQEEIPFMDQTWHLRIAPEPDSARFTPDSRWMLLAGGYGLSLVLGFALMAITTIRRLNRNVEAAMKLGQYTLVEKIGEGGMGQVYRARHALLKRPTAIKLLRSDTSSDHAAARFEREVQATSQLSHPNTIAIYDYGHTPDGLFYYVMEFLPGLDLNDLVQAHGPLPGSRVVHILAQVCGSLAEAHAAGLIHRDIKPHNIRLTERGGIHDFVKVLDFGLVKDVGTGETSTQLTAANTITGTPHYMSPEAVRDSKRVGPRSDLYALGAVGYFLLTGQHVFAGPSAMEVLSSHLYDTPIRPSERMATETTIDADLEAVLMRCLAKEPDDRPASAARLRAELLACACAGHWSEEQAALWWEQNVSTQSDTESESGAVAPTPSDGELGTLSATLTSDPDARLS